MHRSGTGQVGTPPAPNTGEPGQSGYDVPASRLLKPDARSCPHDQSHANSFGQVLPARVVVWVLQVKRQCLLCVPVPAASA